MLVLIVDLSLTDQSEVRLETIPLLKGSADTLPPADVWCC